MTWYGGATSIKKTVKKDHLKIKISMMRIRIGTRKD
jgi:hypothetical protein